MVHHQATQHAAEPHEEVDGKSADRREIDRR